MFFDPNLLIVGQNDGNLLTYDLRAGAAPVIRSRPLPEFPLTALARLKEGLVAIGDAIGSLTVVDLRMDDRKVVGRKGFVGCPAGAVQISAHPRLPLLAVLSHDRIVRLYDIARPGRVAAKSGFVRTRSTCLVMLDDDVPESPSSSDDEWAQLPEDGAGIWDDFRPPDTGHDSSDGEDP
jgi:hypothetical protein